jgi:hypothetical protein
MGTLRWLGGEVRPKRSPARVPGPWQMDDEVERESGASAQIKKPAGLREHSGQT